MWCVVVAESVRARFCFRNNARRDLFRGEVFPVEAVNVPLDGLQAETARREDHAVVVFAERRAEESDALTADFFDRIDRSAEFLFDLRFRQFVHVRMRGGMGADFMSARNDFFYDVGIFFHPETDGEENKTDNTDDNKTDEV